MFIECRTTAEHNGPKTKDQTLKDSLADYLKDGMKAALPHHKRLNKIE